MQSLTGGEQIVDADGRNVGELIADLDQRYPGLKPALVENNRLRPGVAVAVAGVVVQRGLRHPLQADDEVHFIPAIGGG